MNALRVSVLTVGLVAAGVAGAQTVKPDLSGNDPHWIMDPDSHCWAANPTPDEGESIAWTGACVRGLLSGKGTLTWYLNGRIAGRDEGEFRDGELTGHGRIVFADGAIFEGEFPGEGVLTAPDGEKVRAQSIQENPGWSVEQIAK